MPFFNRENELNFLEERYIQSKPQLIIIYGRRRVGKTELVREFIRNKQAVYFLAEKGSIEINFERFVQRLAQSIHQEGIFFKGWVEAFEYVKKQNKKFIIVIDEFPYLIQSDSAITSTFQRIADEVLPNSNLFLILCGSSVSIMEDKVLAYHSPLYGRRTGQWQLNPLFFKESRLFVPGYTIEKQIEIYAVVGNIPMYLLEVNDSLSIKENIRKKILSKGSILYEEPKFVLNQEFSEAGIYFSIFGALAKGKNTIKEISDAIGVDSRNVNKYLNALIRLHYVYKNYSLFYEKNKKRVRYHIKDNFFDFWFKFVNPNFSDLEVGDIENAEKKIFPYFNAFVGRKFEQIAQEVLVQLNRKEKLPFEFDRISNFWDNTKEGIAVEIDRIAVNEKEKKLLIVECKWEENVSVKKLLSDSQKKIKLLSLFEKYKIFYIFFAKTFKYDLKDPFVMLFDLKTIDKAIG
ncbi:MAG: ATP-binding protein [Candidatus Micrarchaeota archaeon]